MSLLFWLKKFVSFWLMPLSAIVVALAAGLWLMRHPRRARLGWTIAAVALGLLVVSGNHYVAYALVRPLETRYAPIPELRTGEPLPAALAACRYVVVLGGGNGHSAGMAATSQLSLSALGRIVEAVRLLRALPDAKLLVSGPSDGRHTAHAVVLARAAMSLGIAENRIVLIDQALDTEDEARLTRAQVGDAPVALVTSAWHMTRAMALFRSAGLSPLPCPADFITHDSEGRSFTQFLWGSEQLHHTTLAVRERIGYLWIKLRGKT